MKNNFEFSPSFELVLRRELNPKHNEHIQIVQWSTATNFFSDFVGTRESSYLPAACTPVMVVALIRKVV